MPLREDGKRRELKNSERWRIIEQLETGKVSVNEVAKKMKVAPTTVSRLEKKHKETLEVETKAGRGSKRLLNEEQSLRLKSLAEEKSFDSYRQLRSQLYGEDLNMPIGRKRLRSSDEEPMINKQTIANELQRFLAVKDSLRGEKSIS